MCGCLSHAPYWEPGLQPRHVFYIFIFILWSNIWKECRVKVQLDDTLSISETVLTDTSLSSGTYTFSARYPACVSWWSLCWGHVVELSKYFKVTFKISYFFIIIFYTFATVHKFYIRICLLSECSHAKYLVAPWSFDSFILKNHELNGKQINRWITLKL